jgi:hypothetical protein
MLGPLRIGMAAALLTAAVHGRADTHVDATHAVNPETLPAGHSARDAPAVSGTAPADDWDAAVRAGESALARGDAEKAVAAFERAAGVRHAAASELGLVRAYMQDGQYRRALAFVAHTAAAHRDSSGGPVLHAWLLAIGGQTQPARAILADARAQWPDDARLADASAQLASATPRATGLLLAPPARLAPYGTGHAVPSRARVVGTGLLADDGTRAVVPLATVTPSSSVWVRNGLGEVSATTIERRIAPLGLAVLRLVHALRVDREFAFAPRDPFPGAPTFTVEYVTAANADPAWPWLHVGFTGKPMAGSRRELGIDLPRGPRGGPVYDGQGRVAGLAIAGNAGPDLVVPQSLLTSIIAPRSGMAAQAGPGTRMPIDQIYERSLLHAVQVIANRTPEKSEARDR